MSKEIQEELWQKYSVLIGTDISDLDYYAGREMMTQANFEKAMTEYIQHQSLKIEQQAKEIETTRSFREYSLLRISELEKEILNLHGTLKVTFYATMPNSTEAEILKEYDKFLERNNL